MKHRLIACRAWFRLWWWLPLIFGIGLALSTAVYYHVRHLEHQAARSVFSQLVSDQQDLVQHTLERSIDVTISLANLMLTQPQASREEFERFGSLVLARYPIFSSVGWSLWVPADQRIATVRRLQSEGYPLSDFTTRRTPGTPLPPAPYGTDHHLVLTRVAPATLARFVGTDVLSIPDRRDSVLRARDLGRAAIIGPLQLGGREDEPGFLVVVPVYRQDQLPTTVADRRTQFIGSASLAFLLKPTLHQIFRPREHRLVRTVLMTRAADGADAILFDSNAARQADTVAEVRTLAQRPLATWRTFSVGERRWDLLAVPTPAYLARLERRENEHSLILALGILTTLMATVAAAVLFRRQQLVRDHLRAQQAAAEELNRANAVLQDTNHDMEQFVSAVSHDLKTPISAIDLSVAVMDRALSGSEPAAVGNALQRIRSATQTMQRIIDDLLAHHRAGWAPQVSSPVDLNAQVRHLLAERRDDIRQRGVEVTVDDLPTLFGDPGRLGAALGNLLDNALKYGCSGPAPRIHIGCRREDKELRIFVRDTGKGVAPEHRQRIFQLFQRLEKDRQGTGMGLAIVERIAHAHRGRVWAEDTPGGGATFVMAFPDDLVTPPREHHHG